MIYIDRSKEAVPKFLRSKIADLMRREIHDFYYSSMKEKAQQRFKFKRRIWADDRVKDALYHLFHGKCAYCESYLSGITGSNIEHFRPKAQAKGLRGDVAPECYAWLAYEWENLYLSCEVCNKNKRNHFPVAGKRAEWGTFGDALRSEKNLLLDPCFDRPERFLLFNDDGSVAANPLSDKFEKKGRGSHHRGDVTIDILGLNRRDLRDSRKLVIKRMIKTLKHFSRKGSPILEELLSIIQDYMYDKQMFAAVQRQAAARWLVSYLDVTDLKKIGEKEPLLACQFEALGLLEKPKMRRVKVAVEKPEPIVEEISMAPEEEPPFFESSAVRTNYIQHIHIKNFKAIQEMELAFVPSHSDRASWKVLLGENGTGKSSVLQAVAIALMGEKHLSKHYVNPDKILRRPSRGRRPHKGSVRIQLSNDPEPIEFQYTRNSIEFTSGGKGINTFLRAYGATRLLPRSDTDKEKGKMNAPRKVENLFNPYSPFIDADGWLGTLNRNEFNTAALTLKDLLNIEDKARLRRIKKQIKIIDDGGVKVTLDELSDGYQSIVALATDILAGIPENLTDMSYATGIILLDELGAYLHPRWKMVIVNSLRTAFPNMQFLAMTHEPLCLRGLEENEVAVLRRENGKICLLDGDDLPSPAGMRADQLLTSHFFGLHTTIDPEIDEKFQNYYRLLERDDNELEEDQLVERDKLKEELKDFGILGSTRRDQMIYEVIDKYLAKGQNMAYPEKLKQLREETKQEAAEIWNSIDIGEEE